MNEKIDTPCSICGKYMLIRKDLGNGRYTITCTSCGSTRGELPPDEKRGVV